MSRFFTGIPLSKRRVLFIDSFLVIAIGLGLFIVGTTDDNNMQISFGLFLLVFALLNPVRMSAMFPTSVFMLWNDEEEKRQQ